jgi:hypothetical protein
MNENRPAAIIAPILNRLDVRMRRIIRKPNIRPAGMPTTATNMRDRIQCSIGRTASHRCKCCGVRHGPIMFNPCAPVSRHPARVFVKWAGRRASRDLSLRANHTVARSRDRWQDQFHSATFDARSVDRVAGRSGFWNDCAVPKVTN